jgi:hypothetical protein
MKQGSYESVYLARKNAARYNKVKDVFLMQNKTY